MERLLIVSIDSHAAAPVEMYLDYMDKPVREDMYWRLFSDERRFQNSMVFTAVRRPEELSSTQNSDLITSGRSRGSWDIKCRLEEMDREGVAAELLFPGAHTGTVPFFDAFSSSAVPLEYRDLGARAYNRWLVDHIGDAGKGRVYGVAYLGSCRNLDATIAEVRWSAKNGFVSISCPGNVADPELKRLHDRHWDPLWAACVELGLVVGIHVGHGGVQGQFMDVADRLQAHIDELDRTGQPIPGNRIEMLQNAIANTAGAEAFGRLQHEPRRILWELMLGGVFDRFPDLKVVWTELRSDWIPGVLAHLDRRHAAGDLPLTKKPSEYWNVNCFTGASLLTPVEAGMRHEIGVTRMMFGRDYPHVEGSWPNTWEWLRATCGRFPENELRLILGENALACYSLMDREFLMAVGARVGPRPEDILGDFKVDPGMIEKFHDRSGFSQPPELIDFAVMDNFLNQDIAGSAAQRATGA